jgi:murein DD-endopeptidase MepM/ murein hydrolase activator NlpD
MITFHKCSFVAASILASCSLGEANAAPWYQSVAPSGRLGPFQHGTFPSLESTKNPELGLTHVGSDIAAPCGSPVYPWKSGIVVDAITSSSQANWDSLGYMAIVDHGADPKSGRRVYSTYFHLKAPPLISSGRIEPSQRLGEVGETGAAIGCHIHFEIRHFSGRFYTKWGNIYGPGNQNGTPDFLQNWSDPARYVSSNLSVPAIIPAGQQRTTTSGGATTASIPSTPRNTLPGRSSEPGTQLSGSSVTISWSTVRGATEYDLSVRDMTDKKSLPIDRQTRTFHIVRVKPGHTYRWSVKACNAAGCSEASERLYFSVK